MMSKIETERESAFTARPTRVLLVDEEASDIKTLRLSLEGQGFDVFTCVNYEAAIRFLESSPVDFVIVSQGTLAFEGRQVLDRAMQLDRHRPVVVVTRCMNMQCYLEAMQMGALDYLEKPVPPAELSRFVRAHVPSAGIRMQRSVA